MTSTLLKAIPAVATPKPAEPVGFPALAAESSRRLKRAMDMTLASVMFLLALPLLALVGIAIFLESGGPVLFAHERIGRGNSRFRLWKFRTMVVDGDELLARHLEENPDAADEWASSRKLRQDPRITRMGRFLRRTSLDELPQLWNVLRGEMSLTGPRPIVESEIRHYGAAFPLYTLAKPGLTGLWQVSGRNDTSYRRRVELDSAYVRHWSLGLDLHLLVRTLGVVLGGKGAY